MNRSCTSTYSYRSILPDPVQVYRIPDVMISYLISESYEQVPMYTLQVGKSPPGCSKCLRAYHPVKLIEHPCAGMLNKEDITDSTVLIDAKQ
jgi:hypothetical protein